MKEVTGGCFCGAIEYEATADINRIALCHCRDCQILSGSAYRTSCLVEPGAFRITRGEPRQFDKTADSGKVRRMLFCGDCGSHLCSLPADPEAEGAFVSIRIATAKEFPELTPAMEIYCDSRVSWLGDLPGILKFPGMPA